MVRFCSDKYKLIKERIGKPNEGRFKKGRIPSRESIEKARISNTGKKRSLESIEKSRLKRIGQKRTKDFCERLSLLKKGKPNFKLRGSKSSSWKGGVTKENELLRHSLDFKLWREAVFKRDDWTCQKCLVKGGYLHPHHILNFSEFTDFRFIEVNGITLCEKHHKEFHKKYGLKNNDFDQIEEFIGRKIVG